MDDRKGDQKTRIRVNRNWKTITLEGQKMVSLIDSGWDYNLLREDGYEKIEGAMLKNQKEKLSRVGGAITSLGNTELLTEIDGVGYDLTYRMVPKGSIAEEIRLGEDLNLTITQLGPGEPAVFSREAVCLEQCEVGGMLEELRTEKAEVSRMLKELHAQKEKIRRLREEGEPEQKKKIVEERKMS